MNPFHCDCNTDLLQTESSEGKTSVEQLLSFCINVVQMYNQKIVFFFKFFFQNKQKVKNEIYCLT